MKTRITFSALTLLIGRQAVHPVCKQWMLVRCVDLTVCSLVQTILHVSEFQLSP